MTESTMPASTADLECIKVLEARQRELLAENSRLFEEHTATLQRQARLVEALRPFAAAVFNDNGDVTYSTGHILSTHYWAAYQELKREQK